MNLLQSATVSEENKGSTGISQQSCHLPLKRGSIIKRVLDLQLLAMVSIRILLSNTQQHIKQLNLLCIKSSTQKTMPYIAQKYSDDGNEWNEFMKKLSADWPHSHVAELCRKLDQFDENDGADSIDYESLKTVYDLSDEEIYEIGATALDCSIMLTIQCANDETDATPG